MESMTSILKRMEEAGKSCLRRTHRRGAVFLSPLPVYDNVTGLVLVSYSRNHRFGGDGHLVLYQYESGKLVELGRVLTWIS